MDDAADLTQWTELSGERPHCDSLCKHLQLQGTMNSCRGKPVLQGRQRAVAEDFQTRAVGNSDVCWTTRLLTVWAFVRAFKN